MYYNSQRIDVDIFVRDFYRRSELLVVCGAAKSELQLHGSSQDIGQVATPTPSIPSFEPFLLGDDASGGMKDSERYQTSVTTQKFHKQLLKSINLR
eukprot:scaffold66_cov115-Cylindrotheca_fusiformis.AAC.19